MVLMLEMFANGRMLDRDCCKLLLDSKVSTSFFSVIDNRAQIRDQPSI